MTAGFVAQFERKVLFRIARFVAFSICLLLFLALVGGALYLGTSMREGSQKPDPAEVVQSLKPKPTTVPGIEPAPAATPAEEASKVGEVKTSGLRGVKIPSELQELILEPENQEVFAGWLNELEKEEHQDFIDGMAAAVRAARENSIESAAAINEYKTRYFEYVDDRKLAALKAESERLYVAGFIISTLVLLALFSLVLVLLAIERNTRLAQET